MKKSVVISLLTIVSLCCTAICSFASTGVVTTDNLRLRKEPSTDSSTFCRYQPAFQGMESSACSLFRQMAYVALKQLVQLPNGAYRTAL